MNVFGEATKKQLRDEQWLADKIHEFGIYPAQEIPEDLWRRNGGLGICQFPDQFAPYLIALSKLGIKSYAEIGLWEGGTFRATIDYLSHFGLKVALGVDVEVRPRAYNHKHTTATPIDFVAKSSRDPAAARAFEKYRPDLVLIDGDHTEEGCRADWELARKHARWVAIHDILDDERYPGVGKVWRSLKQRSKQEFVKLPAGVGGVNGIGLVKVR